MKECSFDMVLVLAGHTLVSEIRSLSFTAMIVGTYVSERQWWARAQLDPYRSL